MYQVVVGDKTLFKTDNYYAAVERLMDERRGELVDPDGWATTYQEFMLDAQEGDAL